jgi:hypothetical protein
MAVCFGFVRSRSSTSAWRRCARRVARRGGLCGEHRDGLDGVLLGMLSFEDIRQFDALQRAIKDETTRRKKSSPVWDTRNAAAATTTPERLEPDPARACPAPTLKSEKDLKTSGSGI